MKHFLFIVLALITSHSIASIPLAQHGKPVAEIIIKPEAHPAIKNAAEELQHWVKEISGAKLPIVNTSGEAPYKILLSVNPESFSPDLKKLAGNDGYAVRTQGNTVQLFGSKPKGVLNGIYKLLFKNSDIIWARPNTEFGTIFTKNPDFTLTQTDYIDIPVYLLRGWQMIGASNLNSDIWQVRNRSNWSSMFLTYKPKYEKYGMICEYGGGHNIVSRYIPEKKFFSKHPEFYPLRNGKRLKPSEFKHATQLCFTNPELLKIFIKELDEKIKANPNYDTYRIMIEDNYKLCECPECLKPLKLTQKNAISGKHIISSKDSRFRSTQFFIWLNKLARHVKENYPGKNILTFAYFFTEPAPYCKIESNLYISFCPIYKNSKLKMNAKGNEVTNTKFKNWLDVTNQLTLREYYGLTAPFPRPVDAIALADWKYANKFGINHTYSEMYADNVSRRMDGIKSWDFNSLYFWVMTNGSWNPYQDVKALRQEFLKRVYGPAAPDIEKFYSLIEDGWHKAGGKSSWRDKANSSWRSSVLEMGTTEKCRQLLISAAKKVTHPNGKKMLASLHKGFEYQTKRCTPTFFIDALQVNDAPAFDASFNTGVWKKAKAITNFLLTNQKPSREKTEIKLLYDKKNLYIGARCFDKEPDKVYSRKGGHPRDLWPAGDKLELFLTGKTKAGKMCYYQIVFDTNGNVYDACNYNKKWNGQFEILQKFNKDSWSSMITIPFKTINMSFNEKLKMRIMFLRYWDHRSKRRETSYWEDGVPHDYNSFGIINFK